MENQDTGNNEPADKKPRRFLKIILIPVCILVVLSIVWIAFSMIGRVNAASVIPDTANLRISISNPVRLLDGILTHEPLQDIPAVPALAPMVSILNMLRDNPILENRLLRLAARGNIEFALLPPETGEGNFVCAWDMGFLSPLLRILPAISGFVNIPNLYYVQSGNNSRFEFRTENMTLYIGPYRNLLFIVNNSRVFESRAAVHSGHAAAFSTIKPSAYDAALVLSNEFVGALLSEQDPSIAAILNNIEFESRVEAGISIYPQKLEFHLAAPLSSRQASLNRLLEQRSRVPGMAERIPEAAQYATILSAGTLEELYQAALVFTPGLDDLLRTAESASRMLLGLTLNDLLFSWSGNEFAVFGLEGRPHPVYAIQIADERKRQEVFDRAFRSIVLGENVRLNLDGTRIPQIQIPEFLQSLLRRWNVVLPSPYYIIYRDFFLVSESADALLSALRAMQRNEVLPRTDAWRNIAGGRTTASAFSLYYSLDLSVPFFLRNNTTLSSFLSLYRQGLARMAIDRGIAEISLVLVPGSGRGINLAAGYPIDIAGRPSNRVHGTVRGGEGRVFFSSGGTAFSLNVADNSISELSGQGTHWIIPAGNANAWVVTDRGRVTFVDRNMEPAAGFPVLTGMRLSSPPAEYDGRLYLCDDNGRVHVVDENGRQSDWETSFIAAIRSAPSFLTVSARNTSNTYVAVYPRTFFGELWLLDTDGRTLPNWPAPMSISDDPFDIGVGYGSPLLFAHNNRVLVAFINQLGHLILYDENAAVVPPFPVMLEGIFYQQPVFDGDYLWLVSSDGNLFRVDLDGEVLFQKIPDFSVKEEGYITVFDSDGDRIPEIFITGEGNALHAFTRNFRSLEGFPLPLWGKPFFVPAQGSRRAEIFGIGMSNRLYRWQFK